VGAVDLEDKGRKGKEAACGVSNETGTLSALVMDVTRCERHI
jgi:hypothetical protein